MVFGGLSVDDAIRLYFEKCDAIQRGDLTALRDIKKKCPQLFNGLVEQEIIILLDYVSRLRKTPDFQRRYKEFCKDKARAENQFTLVEGVDDE